MNISGSDSDTEDSMYITLDVLAENPEESLGNYVFVALYRYDQIKLDSADLDPSVE